MQAAAATAAEAGPLLDTAIDLACQAQVKSSSQLRKVQCSPSNPSGHIQQLDEIIAFACMELLLKRFEDWMSEQGSLSSASIPTYLSGIRRSYRTEYQTSPYSPELLACGRAVVSSSWARSAEHQWGLFLREQASDATVQPLLQLLKGPVETRRRAGAAVAARPGGAVRRRAGAGPGGAAGRPRRARWQAKLNGFETWLAEQGDLKRRTIRTYVLRVGRLSRRGVRLSRLLSVSFLQEQEGDYRTALKRFRGYCKAQLRRRG